MNDFNYGDIIEYIDGTVDENFTNARNWAELHKVTFDEDLEQQDLPKRYFVIGNQTVESQRALREQRFEAEADPIRYAYDEALARGEDSAEQLKAEWLAKKDEIRADLPYPEEPVNE